VTQATGRANSVRAEAQAQADATTLRGNAEASAIKAKGDALAANPNLVALIQAAPKCSDPWETPGGRNRFISKVGRQRPQLNRCLGAILVRPSPPNAFLWAQELLYCDCRFGALMWINLVEIFGASILLIGPDPGGIPIPRHPAARINKSLQA
jgi:hypothetical protein